MSKSGPVRLSAEVVDAWHECLGMCLTILANLDRHVVEENKLALQQLGAKLEDLQVTLEALCQRES